LETTVAHELESMDIRKVRPLKGGVAFFGSLEQAYRACLWLRSASRVLLVLLRCSAKDAASLYAGAQTIDWSLHLNPDLTFAVSARGTNTELKNTQFTALKVKDALCDDLVKKFGSRPDVRQHRPDVQLEVAVRQDKASLYLDLSGEPLHRRGYRTQGEQGAAPLKENLAAGILLKSGWLGTVTSQKNRIEEEQQATRQREILLDPLCGSGTFLHEAAMIAADMAPGLLREYWGFSGWLGHQEETWNELLEEARVRLEKGRANMPRLIGLDTDEAVLDLAQQQAERAGFGDRILFRHASVEQARRVVETALSEDSKKGEIIELGKTARQGMVVTNPPYAERMMSENDLPLLYRKMRQGLQGLPAEWTAHLITPDTSIDMHLGLSPYETETLYNGKIEATLRHYHLSDFASNTLQINRPQDGIPVSVSVLDKGAGQFAARLRKVDKERRKWAKREGISCYRVYDADLPDYAFAIDRYEGIQGSTHEVYTCVAEYKAPKEIDPEKVQRRHFDAMNIIPVVMDIDENNVISKVRERAKGGGQYREAGDDLETRVLVKEQGLTFEVDLRGYLDTGLFLDHRLTRDLIRKKAEGKDFLNLFAYTGTATVYAAAGGAHSTTTIDMSNTYLSWFKRNMSLNGFTGSEHRAERADVLAWLKKEKMSGARYDLIFVDPPTFSNSKKMEVASWSVQRDHVDLLKDVVSLLRPKGEVLFSCNLRSFKPDVDGLSASGISIEDITEKTIPEDFKRSKRIHRCYAVYRKYRQST